MSTNIRVSFILISILVLMTTQALTKHLMTQQQSNKNNNNQLENIKIHEKSYQENFKHNSNYENTALKQQQTLQKQQKQRELYKHKSEYHKRRRHHKSYDKKSDVDAPTTTTNDLRLNYHTLNASPNRDVIKYATNDASGYNINNNNNNTLSEQKRKRRELSDWLIAPNTRWCGRGNLANGTYNHLGGASKADKCCRKHDHCQMYIPAMSMRYELFNYRPYTLSHCKCDRRFRTCLKLAIDEDANTIGKLFFNMVQTQCFILRSEKICRKRAEDGNCEIEAEKVKAYMRNNRKY